MCKAFKDIVSEERERVIRDNKMCSFCPLHKMGEICYTKVNKAKPICYMPKCKGRHILWIHDILKGTLCPKQVEPEKAKPSESKKEKMGTVSVALGKGGWRTLVDS